MTSARWQRGHFSMVTFTGSGRVDCLLATRNGAQIKRFTLKMDGKNLPVVLADADLNADSRARLGARTGDR